MRELADAARIGRFMRSFGRAARTEGRVYFTGGATAVLLGWRPTTMDIDLRLVPENDELLREIPRLKDELRVNVELAWPGDFIPVPDGWEDRSLFAAREGKLDFYHVDPSSQALAKLERAHVQDLEDVESMAATGLIRPAELISLFERIEPVLHRYPAVDPPSFRRRVVQAFEPR